MHCNVTDNVTENVTDNVSDNVTENVTEKMCHLLVGRVDDALVDRCHHCFADCAGQKVAWFGKFRHLSFKQNLQRMGNYETNEIEKTQNYPQIVGERG